MTDHATSLIGTGIYSVPEASRLSRVSTGRIRRWLRGYKFKTKRKQHHSPALWHGQLEPIGNSLALGFLDLIEIRFVDAFLGAGVSWHMIRRAHERAVKEFETEHPFCTQGFVTDGREIFWQLHRDTREPSLVEIVSNQHVFAQIFAPFLKELEFGRDDMLIRWHPRTSRNLVVVDPSRSFGRPIVTRRGVPTEILASAVRACKSTAEVSRWYEVASEEIEDAVEFEQRMAA
jgi:uncharacterized protein (DUF433 family)